MMFLLFPDRVESYERAPVAKARLSEVKSGVLVSTEKDLLKVDVKLLVSIYNVAASEPGQKAQTVNRFSDQKAAARRVFPVIEYLAKPGPIPAITSSTENADMASKKKSSTKKSAAKKTTNGESAGRPSAFSGKTIHKLVDKNPRREGTAGYKAWEKLRSGMTYEQYLAAGGARNHLAWDLEHKFVELKAAKA
jgi:hypothetical protein